MKRSISLLAVLGAVALTAPASADPTVLFTESGTILVGNPITRETGGITETSASCGESIDPEVPADTAQGVDGHWIYLGDDPTGLWEQSATLTATRTIPSNPAPVGTGNDVDAWFYDGGCTLIKPTVHTQAYHMATTGSSEFGVVPSGAQWVAVTLYRGVNAPFTFTVTG